MKEKEILTSEDIEITPTNIATKETLGQEQETMKKEDKGNHLTPRLIAEVRIRSEKTTTLSELGKSHREFMSTNLFKEGSKVVQTLIET